MALDNLLMYGWAEGVNKYCPHVTLAWVGSAGSAAISVGNTGNAGSVGCGRWLEEVAFLALPVTFEKVGVYVMGNRGTCVQLLRGYDL